MLSCGMAYGGCAHSACAKKRPADWIDQAARFAERIEMLRHSPVAIHTDAANAQHYELPPAFFELCLGKRLKYSGVLLPARRGIAGAGRRCHARAVWRARRTPGRPRNTRTRLRLGLADACGWPNAILTPGLSPYPTQISNANTSRAQCRQRCLGNVRVITQDVNRLELDAGQFDRCVSVEMFEHMRNYDILLGRIASWLRPAGKLFVHHLCTRNSDVSVRDGGRGQLDGPAFLHRRSDAGMPTLCSGSSAT